MPLHTFLTLITVSLNTGAVFALFALGYALVYSVLGLMNLAHGDVMMVATFVALLAWEITKSAVVAIPIGLVAGAVVGAAVDQVAYRPLRFTGDSIAPLVTSLGAAYIIRNVITNVYGPNARSFPNLIGLHEVKVGSGSIPVGALALIGVALAGAYGSHRFLDRTRAGWVVRAVSSDITAARLVGLRVGTVLLITYAVAGAVAALGGIVWSSSTTALDQSVGWTATTAAFTAAVLGGLGSLPGAIYGGVILGFAETFVAYFSPNSYEQAVQFGLLFIVILIRPTADHRRLRGPVRA